MTLITATKISSTYVSTPHGIFLFRDSLAYVKYLPFNHQGYYRIIINLIHNPYVSRSRDCKLVFNAWILLIPLLLKICWFSTFVKISNRSQTTVKVTSTPCTKQPHVWSLQQVMYWLCFYRFIITLPDKTMSDLFFVGQNFRHVSKFSSLLSDIFLPDKVLLKSNTKI